MGSGSGEAAASSKASSSPSLQPLTHPSPPSPEGPLLPPYQSYHTDDTPSTETHPTDTVTQQRQQGNGDDDDDDDQQQPESLKVRHWKASPFAVGLVEPTWADEHAECHQLFCGTRTGRRIYCHVWCSAYVCSRLGADRVGNMAVLHSKSVEQIWMDPVSRQQRVSPSSSRPKLIWVVGPYWIITATMTFPIIAAVSLWTATTSLAQQSMGVIAGWCCCTILLIVSLLMIACRDPGILYRHANPPAGPEGESWRWNDQAQTFRPPKAKFDPECAVVLEGFDHTCPWTGTAIAKKNMMWFRIFVLLVLVCLLYNMVLITTTKIK